MPFELAKDMSRVSQFYERSDDFVSSDSNHRNPALTHSACAEKAENDEVNSFCQPLKQRAGSDAPSSCFLRLQRELWQSGKPIGTIHSWYAHSPSQTASPEPQTILTTPTNIQARIQGLSLHRIRINLEVDGIDCIFCLAENGDRTDDNILL